MRSKFDKRLRGHDKTDDKFTTKRYGYAGGVKDERTPLASMNILGYLVARNHRTLPAGAPESLRSDALFPDIMRMVFALQNLPRWARLYTEVTAYGRQFFRIKFDLEPDENGRRRQKSIYLGTNPDLANMVRDHLDYMREPVIESSPQLLDEAKVQALREMIRKTNKAAKTIAEKAGFRLNGCMLVEQRKKKNMSPGGNEQ